MIVILVFTPLWRPPPKPYIHGTCRRASFPQVKDLFEGRADAADIPEEFDLPTTETLESMCRTDEVCDIFDYVASQLKAELECRPLTCSSDIETIIENSGLGTGGGGGGGGGVDLEASVKF